MIQEWVADAPQRHANFRKAVHIILHAIAGVKTLNEDMKLKGGMLMSLAYTSTRYTKDLDFSTNKPYATFNQESFKAVLERALVESVAQTGHGIDCRIQRMAPNPNRPQATFVTLEISIGYAPLGSTEHRRLLRGQCPSTVSLDYSFNEITNNLEQFELEDGLSIWAYADVDIVAEKLRAVLQQPTRNRYRRQDIYDLSWLITRRAFSDDERHKILASLKAKAASRNIPVSKEAIHDPNVRIHAEKDYAQLADELEGELPVFDNLFSNVARFYDELPWDA